MNSSTSKRIPQRDIVLQHLMDNPSITSVEAMTVHKIPRLAARIGELRERGWNIRSVRRVDAAGDRYIRYTLGTPRHPLAWAIVNGETVDIIRLSELTDGYLFSLKEAHNLLANLGEATRIETDRNGEAFLVRYRH